MNDRPAGGEPPGPVIARESRHCHRLVRSAKGLAAAVLAARRSGPRGLPRATIESAEDQRMKREDVGGPEDLGQRHRASPVWVRVATEEPQKRQEKAEALFRSLSEKLSRLELAELLLHVAERPEELAAALDAHLFEERDE